MKNNMLIIAMIAMFSLYSCTKVNTEKEKMPLDIFSVNKSGSVFSDIGFSQGDKIGLYIVARQNTTTSDVLKASGNLFDNKMFTYSGGVMSSDVADVYPDGIEWVDMYGYAPYSPLSLTTGGLLAFSVSENQATSLSESDLLWVKKEAVQTTTAAPELVFSHKLSKVIVKLTAGVGVALTNPTVVINNVLPSTKFNMASGLPGIAEGSAVSISPFKISSVFEYHAVIIPQEISQLNNFIAINNGGKTYNYTLPAIKIFETGKIYTYEIEVNADDLSVSIAGSMNGWGVGDTTQGEAK